MNNIEELTFKYLSSYFNQDLNESLEQISEEDLRSALIDLNILAVALNQYVTEQLQIPTNPFSNEIGFPTTNSRLMGLAQNVRARQTKKSSSVPGHEINTSRYDTTPIEGDINRALVTHALNATIGKNNKDFSPATVDYKPEKLSDAGRQNMEKLDALDDITTEVQQVPETKPSLLPNDKALELLKQRYPDLDTTDKGDVAKKAAELLNQEMKNVGVNIKNPTDAYETEVLGPLRKMTDDLYNRAKGKLETVRSAARRRDVESQETSSVGSPERYEFYKSRGVKASGIPSYSKMGPPTESGEMETGPEIEDSRAYTLDDKLKYHVGKAREERDATAKRMLDMQMMREFGTTDPAKMRYEQYGGFAGGVGDGGGSSYGQVSARNGWDRFDLNKRIRDARRSASQQEAIPWNQDLMDRIVARTNTPEAIADRERQTQEFDAASRARDEYASSERGQAEIDRRVSAENASRQQRGLPPLNAAAENRLRRSVIADGGRRDQRAAERDARMGLPPVGTPQPQTTPSSEEPYQSEEDYMDSVFTPYQSEEDYMKSVFPSRTVDSNSVPGSENAPPGARTTFTGPGGAGFSTLRSPTPIISTRGIINNLSGRTSVASALNSRGFRPANPIMNRLRPGGMIA